MFILIKGFINKNSFKDLVKSIVNPTTQKPLSTQDVVFIFPGNPTHHGANAALFKRKSGGGLALTAGELSDEGIPTLSLPTTGIPTLTPEDRQILDALANPKEGRQFSEEESKPELEHLVLVNQAIADLWRAAGAEYHLALPVRDKKFGKRFFTETLEMENEEVEPNFWGGINTSANPLLGDYYIEQVALLNEFLELKADPSKKKEANTFFSQKVPQIFQQAFQTGGVTLKATSLPYWLWPKTAHDKLAEIKQAVLQPINKYMGWWKLPIFGHHHEERAEAVKKAILSAVTLDEIETILKNQDDLFKVDMFDPQNKTKNIPHGLEERFSKQLKNKPKDLYPSGFHTAIRESIEILTSQSVVFDALIKKTGDETRSQHP